MVAGSTSSRINIKKSVSAHRRELGAGSMDFSFQQVDKRVRWNCRTADDYRSVDPSFNITSELNRYLHASIHRSGTSDINRFP